MFFEHPAQEFNPSISFTNQKDGDICGEPAVSGMRP
jgi:hypothetical protein